MFYDWLETNQIPKSAIALWQGLMHIANKAGWEKSFTVAVSTIESKTGFKRSELFEARNILTQKGRINWRQRGGNLCAEYEINFFCVHNTDAKAYAKAYTSTDAKAYTKPTQKHTITKLDKTKLNNPSGDASPVAEKKEKIIFWKELVEVWFNFYKQKFSQEPTFNGQAAKALQVIITNIQKAAEKGEKEWTEEFAKNCLQNFFNKAYHFDNWLRDNFLLPVLQSKFDAIVKKQENGNFNGKQKGALVGTFIEKDRVFGPL